RNAQISRQYAKDGTTFLIRSIDMIFEAPFKLACVLNRDLFVAIPQNSKSKENWIWRAPVPAIGCLNPGIGVRLEPKTGLIWETFALLNKLKNSATTSRRFAPPNGKYFRMRKSIVANAGVFREFLPRLSGLAESGRA